MEENENIDNLFRSAIEPVEIAPPEKTWDAIDARLTREAAKRKSNNRWFLFVVLAVLLSVGELIYVMEVPNPRPITYFSKPKSQNSPSAAAQTSPTDPATPNKTDKPLYQKTRGTYADSMSAHQRANAIAMSKDEETTLPENITSTEPTASLNNSNEGLSKEVNPASKPSSKVSDAISAREKKAASLNKGSSELPTISASSKAPKVRSSDAGKNAITNNSGKVTDTDIAPKAARSRKNDNSGTTTEIKEPANRNKNISGRNTGKTLDAGIGREANNSSTEARPANTPLAKTETTSTPAENKITPSEANTTATEKAPRALDAPADEHSTPVTRSRDAGDTSSTGSASSSNENNTSGMKSDGKSDATAKEAGNTVQDNTVNNSQRTGQVENKDGSRTGNESPANEPPASSASTTQPEQTPANETQTTSASPSAAKGTSSSLPKLNNFITQSAISIFYSPEMNKVYWNIESNSVTTSTTKLEPSFNTGLYLHHDLGTHWSMAIGCTYSTLIEVTTINTSYVLPGGPSKQPHGNSPPPPNQHDTTFKHHFKDTAYFNHYFHGDPGGNNYNFNSPCGTIHLQTTPKFPVPKGNSKPGDVINFETKTRQVLEFINVPVTARYQVSKGRFSLYGTAGVSASFLLNKQATVTIADSYSETTNEIDGLRTVNYGYQFGLGVQYLFYKRFSIFIEPSFRGPITSVTQDLSTTLYPYSTGAHAGLYFHF